MLLVEVRVEVIGLRLGLEKYILGVLDVVDNLQKAVVT